MSTSILETKKMATSRSDRERYLLRTPSQIRSFRLRYARMIEERSSVFQDWVRSLPLMEWSPLLIRQGYEEQTIGILCILYIDGQICISFSEDIQFIRNEPLDDEEYRKWSETFFKRRDYRRKEPDIKEPISRRKEKFK